MRYSEVLPEVLAGKFVRVAGNMHWMRMKDSGVFELADGEVVGVQRSWYSSEAWEVKPEEVYVIGHSVADCKSFSNFISDNIDEVNKYRLSNSIYPLFPTDAPQKYKLVPVEDN